MLTYVHVKWKKSCKHDAVEQNYINHLSLYIIHFVFLLLTKISENVLIQLTTVKLPYHEH